MAEFQHIGHQSGLHGAVASSVGGREENQDSFLIGETPLGLLVIVCDGMGGGPAGKTASSLAAATMLQMAAQAGPEMNPDDMLRQIAEGANQALLRAVEADPSLRGMGTTCVALIINAGKAYILHVGDSRCYQIRDARAVFRTADHSFVAELVRKGTLTEEQARNSNYSNVITRAVGSPDNFSPEIDVVDVKPADRFALMTDGIWGMVEESRLVDALAAEGEVADIVGNVVSAVDEMGREKGGGHDNLTLAMIELPAVMTIVPPRDLDTEPAAPADESWHVCDDDDPVSSYVIDDGAEAVTVTPPRTLAEKVASEVARKKVSDVGHPGKSEKAGKHDKDGETAKSATTDNEGKDVMTKRKISGKWIWLACAAVVILALIGSNVYLYFHPVKSSAPLALTDSLPSSDTLDRINICDDAVENLAEVGSDKEAAGLQDISDPAPDVIDKGIDPQLAQVDPSGQNDATGKSPLGYIPGRNSDNSNGRGAGNVSLDVVRDVIRQLENLRNEKGNPVKKNEPGYDERLDRRTREVQDIIDKLDNCRRSLPDNEKVKKQKLAHVAKELKKAPGIDKRQGYPTDDAIKAIEYSISLLKGI